MIYIIGLSSLTIIAIITIIIQRKNIKKKSNNYKLLQSISNEKFTALFSNYYKLSKSYLALAVEYLNYNPEFIKEAYEADREAIMGVVCTDLTILKTEVIEYISDMLLEKISASGEQTLTQNERLFLDITSGNIR